MSIASADAGSTDLDLGLGDLGPLAWVLDELRKSLDGATKALKRFVRDAELARGSDLASVDGSQLRIARQQLHQAVGALEMVGLPGPALVLRAMESVAQRFVERPELCSDDAANKVERAGFALTEYLEVVLAGKPVSPVALFSQYRDVQEIAKADRIHPADLWVLQWRWSPIVLPPSAPLAFDDAVRAQLDTVVLQIMKSDAAASSGALAFSQTCLGLGAQGQSDHGLAFWQITAAVFQAIGLRLLDVDVYVKRALPRILLQYAAMARGEMNPSDRLAHDLLFFCAQAAPAPAGQAPVLEAVHAAYGLARFRPVRYLEASFGRFDPAVLVQARKRIAAAKETWTLLAGGDLQKFKALNDQFGLVSDSITRLHPASAAFAQTLTSSVDGVVRSGTAPSAELGMEVATSILYLEAAFEDLDPSDPQLANRTGQLAQRLQRVSQGGQSEPLESWMEDLYRRVSDRQTMGSVVGELRLSLGELEKCLDQFFRNPQEKSSLQPVPSQLAQMRGVLSVLGLDQATQAVSRMRDTVEEMLVTEIDEARARAAGTFDQLGNNLGALGFLIDMLSYQPALAKKLFVYDAQRNELKPLMGRSVAATEVVPVAQAASTLSHEALSLLHASTLEVPALELRLDALATHAALDDNAALAKAARQASVAVHSQNADAAAVAMHDLAATVILPAPIAVSAAPSDDIEEDDLRDIFLEEAREVVIGGYAALETLKSNPAALSELTTLRRAFHTLKGSSRMVGLSVFGDAAWAMEQALNTWLADQKPASEPLVKLCSQSLDAFGAWTDDISAGTDQHWIAQPFVDSAEAMRTHGVLRAIEPQISAAAIASEIPVAIETVATNDHSALALDDFDFDLSSLEPEHPVATPHEPQHAHAEAPHAPAPLSLPEPEIEIEGIDFDSLAALSITEPGHAQAAPTVQPLLAPTEGEPTAARAPDLPDDFLFDLDVAQLDSAHASALEQSASDLKPEDIDALFDFPAEPSLAPEPQPLAAEAPQVDEQVKVIGDLQISLPLYNVYLNEADEWSRRLVTELGEWAMELHRPLPESCVALAHSLGGSSATVGFTALSELARSLEHSLQHVHMVSGGTPECASVCVQAAEEIRHLLHQFAAGFLKEPSAQLLASVRALQSVPAAVEPEKISQTDSDFAALFVSAPAPLAEIAPAAVVAPVLVAAVASVAALPATPAAAHVPERVPAPLPVPQLVLPAAVSPGPRRIALVETGTDEALEDDELDAVDAIDPDLFPIFDEEAAELMPQMGAALRQWAARPDDQNARSSVLRHLHTLKGSARLAGAMRLGEIAHHMETRIERLGSATQDVVAIESLQHRFDGLETTLDALRRLDAKAQDLQQVSDPVDAAALAGLASAHAVAAAAPAAATVAAGEAAQAPVHTPTDAPASAPSAPVALRPRAPTITTGGMVQRAGAGQSVRVRSQLLDRLVNQAGEVIITRTRLENELGQLRTSLGDLTGNLDRLRQQLRDIELQAESQMQSRLAQAKDTAQGFDPLEFDRFTRVQELTRMMAESVNDVATVQRSLQRTVESTEDDLIAQARQTRELQRDLLRTRMVEFEGISERLYRVVRQASKDTGKQVKLDITGGSIEMDRGVLDRMTPAFEHLLRNCVAHGIELAEQRVASGKDASGLITISLGQEGNDVSVEFKDDGAGLNLARIREKALSLGLVSADQILADADAANLVFMPGFSTANQVTELAGRGIGMDVVRSEVQALGGRIETTTQTGHGASFKLVLPLTTAVTQVVMLRTGSLAIGVPANVVETVRRATPKELLQAYNSGQYEMGGVAIPFFWSGALLQASARSVEPQGKTIPVVVFRSAAQRVAMHVDEVLGNQEVVVKNLGPQLSRLPGLAGMTVLASGAAALIYNPVALATVYGDRARALSADHAQPHMLEAGAGAALPVLMAAAAPLAPLVLVVDDSITVRRVTQRLLQREGFRVALAADGLLALEKLQEELPTLVLSDIEMPRMDGFDLARNIRGDARLAKLPIVMITSRIADKHREHAMELGVNHYLGKPYSEEELLSLVRHYAAAGLLTTA